MLDRLFFISLLLNATGLFRFIAPQLGVSIGVVSSVILGFNCFYIAVRLAITHKALAQMSALRWLVLLIIWPLITSLWAPVFDLRQAGLQFYYFTLMLGTLVYVRRNGLKPIYIMTSVSIIITIIGMPVSLMAPQHFAPVAELANARAFEMGRPVGFFMQPNRLAMSLALLFLVWFGLWRRRTVLREAIALLVFLAAEMGTGSRMGVLLAIGVCGLVLLYRWPERMARGRFFIRWFLIAFLLVISVLGFRSYLSFEADPSHRRDGDLVSRIDSMLSLDFSPQGSLLKDQSLNTRWRAQQQFLQMILHRPLSGYGLGAESLYVRSGTFSASAHSQMLSQAFEYGCFYPLYFFFALFMLYSNRNRKWIQTALGTNYITQYVAICVLLYAYGPLTAGRVFYITLGLSVGLLDYPDLVYNWTGKIPRVLQGADDNGNSQLHE